MFYLILAFCIVLIIINFDKLKAYFAVPITTASDNLKKATDKTKDALNQIASSASSIPPTSTASSTTPPVTPPAATTPVVPLAPPAVPLAPTQISPDTIKIITNDILAATNEITKATDISKQITQLITNMVDALNAENTAIQSAQNSVSAIITNNLQSITTLKTTQSQFQKCLQLCKQMLALTPQLRSILPGSTQKINELIVLNAQINSMKIVYDFINKNATIAPGWSTSFNSTIKPPPSDVDAYINVIKILNTGTIQLNMISMDRLGENIADIQEYNIKINDFVSLYDAIQKNNSEIKPLPVQPYIEAVDKSKSLILQITTDMNELLQKSQSIKNALSDSTDTRSISVKMSEANSLHALATSKLTAANQNIELLNNILLYATSQQNSITTLINTTQVQIRSLVAASTPLTNDINNLVEDIDKKGSLSSYITSISKTVDGMSTGLDSCVQFQLDYNGFKQQLSNTSNMLRTVLRQIVYVVNSLTATNVQLLQSSDGTMACTVNNGRTIMTGVMLYELIPDVMTANYTQNMIQVGSRQTNAISSIPVEGIVPINKPTVQPTIQPTLQATLQPTLQPTVQANTIQILPQATLQATLQPTVIVQATDVQPTVQIQMPTGPKYLGCYSENPTRMLDVNNGFKTINQCNTAAKAAGKSYFGMQFWQGGGVSNGKNMGLAECRWSSSNAPLGKLQGYNGAPGGGAGNAPKCTNNTFNTDCISNDTLFACPINVGSDGPADGHLGGPWVNALYNVY